MAASSDKFQNIAKLRQNDKNSFLEASEILLKFANNIIKNPGNPKYRKIRVGNEIVMQKLLPVSGAVECLFDMGFEEDDEYFTLPSSSDISKVIKFRDELAAYRNQASDQAVSKVTNRSISGQSSKTSGNVQPPRYDMQVQATFLRKILSSYEHILMYEDPNLQAKARTCIPVKTLTDQAISKQTSLSSQGETVDLQDLILLELLAWFKHSFFHWIDAPKCDQCGNSTRNIGMATPTPEELTWGAGRVENYECTQCHVHTRFPRYNHPGKLLETRGGRCGEWANCFTLCCRSIGFEARYVLDWTDHVWTEVFSESQNRWLHCDPCENICDKPLVYESGWNKKLTYIFAFSKDDIQDVTWRYSSKHSELLQRRREVPERFILNTIKRLRNQRQKNLSTPRKKQLLDRLVIEIVEFMSPKVAGSDEQSGRQSGSMAWRMARGEIHPGGNDNTQSSYTFKPTENEVKNKVIHIQYNCATDTYVRVSDGGSKTIGWQTRTFEVKDVHRKVEEDWKMAYLARRDGTSTASITWKFDCEALVVDKIEVKALSTCYENGHVSWRLCAGDQCAVLRKDGKKTEIKDLAGSKEMTLTAELTLGQGDVAWQHTQLFRQSLSDTNTFPFDIKIFLKE